MAADLSSMSALDYIITILTVIIGVPSTTYVALYILYIAISIIESIVKAFEIRTKPISDILNNIAIAAIIIVPIITTIATIFLSIKYPIYTFLFALFITCVAMFINLYMIDEDVTNETQENTNNNETNSESNNETKDENENQNEIINKYKTII